MRKILVSTPFFYAWMNGHLTLWRKTRKKDKKNIENVA